MKKRHLKILFATGAIACSILCLSACGDDSNETDSNKASSQSTDYNTENSNNESKKENVKSKEVELLDAGYFVTDDYYLKYGFVIVNPDENTAYEFPKVIITTYDDNGDVLSTEEQTMNKLQPGEQQTFGSVIDCNGKKPKKVEFNVESGDKISPSDDAIKSSDLEISGTNERTDEFGDVSVTGKVKNNSSSDTSSVAVSVIFKNGDKIVCGTTTYVDDVNAGQEKAFEVSEYGLPEHDSFEVCAYDWGS